MTERPSEKDEKDKSLADVLGELFDADEDIREAVLIGKLPSNIAEVAAAALSQQGRSMPIPLGAPDHWLAVGKVVQQKFFPDAPDLERGGFLRAITGMGPRPAWLVAFQVAQQCINQAREMGIDVPETEEEKLVRKYKTQEDGTRDDA